MFKSRYEKYKSERNNWDEFWEDIANFTAPDKNDVFQKYSREKGDRKYNRLYEASAVHFNEMLANTLHSMMTNPSQVWFELNHRNKRLNQIPAVRKYMQELSEKMIQILNNTNFQAQVHEVYLDLGSFGTGVMGIFEDDDNVMRFDSKPIYYFHIKENSKGVVDEICYEKEYKVEEAFDEFGEESFGEEAIRLREDMDKKIKILHFIMPRDTSERVGLGGKSKPFQSTYIYCEKDMIIKEEGFNEFPFVVPRWIKLTDEKYGRSPAMKALPDIKMLNAIMKTTIRGAQKMVDPPLMVPDDGILGRVNARPGGLIPYRSGTQDRVFPLETKANPSVGVELMQDIRERVKQHFFVDQFQLREGPQMTATEVNARVEMQLRLLGPILGRLHFEFLQPMVNRMLQIMIRKGLMPENIPPELVEGEFELEVFFTSQIARAQRSGEANDIMTFLNSIAPVVEFDREAADVVDPDSLVRKLAMLRGVSEDILRESDEVEGIREARAEQTSQRLQTEQEMAGAEILSKGVPAVQQLGLAQG